jgi:hypothetical protein
MERMNWLDKLIFAAILILMAALLTPPKAKGAETWLTYVFPNGRGALSLSQEPCTVPQILMEWEKVRAQVQVQLDLDIGAPKQSRLLYDGKIYEACYVVGPDNERVYNIDALLERLQPPPPLDLFAPHESVAPKGGTKI